MFVNKTRPASLVTILKPHCVSLIFFTHKNQTRKWKPFISIVRKKDLYKIKWHIFYEPVVEIGSDIFLTLYHTDSNQDSHFSAITKFNDFSKFFVQISRYNFLVLCGLHIILDSLTSLTLLFRWSI